MQLQRSFRKDTTRGETYLGNPSHVQLTPRDGCYVPVTKVSTGPERIEHEEVATMATMTSSQFWDHMKEKAAMHRLPWVSTGASVLL